MDSKSFQSSLHKFAFALAEESEILFSASYKSDWPDEETTTGALFGALVSMANRTSHEKFGIRLKAQFTTKRDEASHGADIFVRFLCNEPQWQISTTTVIQAKRVEPTQMMTSSDHKRLTMQLNKMLAHTTESFVLIYSQESGIQALPAVAARSLTTKQPFDAQTIGWGLFLSGIFRGRMGEPNPARLPSNPRHQLTIVAETATATPAASAMGAD